MPHIWTDSHSFSTGLLQSKDAAFLIMSDDQFAAEDISHSIPIMWIKGEWFPLETIIPWICLSTCIFGDVERKVLALGQWGEVLIVDNNAKCTNEIVMEKGNGPQVLGPLRRVRSINNVPYACGMSRQVYFRELNNHWKSIGPLQDKFSNNISGFESIDGISESDIYAVGISGEIWSFDGLIWRQLDSPVNTILNDVCCAPDGQVYICGRQGVLLVGHQDTWKAVDHAFYDEDFWSITLYRNTIFLASLKNIYYLNNNELLPVKFGDDFPKTCYHLCAENDRLLSIGEKDVMIFDGYIWSRID